MKTLYEFKLVYQESLAEGVSIYTGPRSCFADRGEARMALCASAIFDYCPRARRQRLPVVLSVSKIKVPGFRGVRVLPCRYGADDQCCLKVGLRCYGLYPGTSRYIQKLAGDQKRLWFKIAVAE